MTMTMRRCADDVAMQAHRPFKHRNLATRWGMLPCHIHDAIATKRRMWLVIPLQLLSVARAVLRVPMVQLQLAPHGYASTTALTVLAPLSSAGAIWCSCRTAPMEILLRFQSTILEKCNLLSFVSSILARI
jgi:hypothetical protein